MTKANPDTETVDEDVSDATAGSDLDLDTTFHLLQTERRRLALRYLFERERAGETVVEMRDVAEQVAAWEHDTTVEELESDQRQRVYVGLYQTHLPKLDQHDVIDYEQSRGWIELQPESRSLETYLERAPDGGPPNPPDRETRSADVGTAAADEAATIRESHLLLAAIGLVPLAVLASGFGPDVVVSEALLGIALLTAVVVGGGLHEYLDGTLVS